MNHPFFTLAPPEQKRIQLKLAAAFIGFNLIAGSLLFVIGLVPLIPFVFAFSLSVFAPFVDCPSGVKAGNLIYYSPLLVGEKIKKNRLVLHAGSLFDYYFVLDKDQSARERKKFVYQNYTQGLLAVIEEFESQRPTQITIKATSYILNPRTAKKLGLELVQTDILQRVILYFNFINLTFASSLLNKKLTWPKMNKIYTFEGKLDVLIEKKDELIALQAKLM